MLPATTCSPPKRFMPSRCEWLSRPLRDVPCPFLCAMKFSLRLTLYALRLFRLNRRNFHPCQGLAVTACLVITLAASIDKMGHFFGEAIFDKLARDMGAWNGRIA